MPKKTKTNSVADPKGIQDNALDRVKIAIACDAKTIERIAENNYADGVFWGLMIGAMTLFAAALYWKYSRGGRSE